MVAVKPAGPSWTLPMVDALEHQTGERFELIDGHIYAMAGGSLEHSAVCSEASYQLNRAFDDASAQCRAFSSDARVKVRAGESFRYPDVPVLCGAPERGDDERLLNPTALVEVTSRTTRDIDYGAKLEEYRALPSLQSYVIVDLQERQVVVHARTSAGWTEAAHERGVVSVPGTPAALDVERLFRAAELGRRR